MYFYDIPVIKIILLPDMKITWSLLEAEIKVATRDVIAVRRLVFCMYRTMYSVQYDEILLS